MNILVTGARGFVGKNLVAALQNIRDGKDRTHSELDIREIYKYNTDGSPEQLADYAKSADFVFHLAGVNRPETAEEYLPGNTESLEALLTALQSAGIRKHCGGCNRSNHKDCGCPGGYGVRGFVLAIHGNDVDQCYHAHSVNYHYGNFVRKNDRNLPLYFHSTNSVCHHDQ